VLLALTMMPFGAIAAYAAELGAQSEFDPAIDQTEVNGDESAPLASETDIADEAAEDDDLLSDDMSLDSFTSDAEGLSFDDTNQTEASVIIVTGIEQMLTLMEGGSVSYQEALNSSLAWMIIDTPNPLVGSVHGEWVIISLARAGVQPGDTVAGVTMPLDYYDNYLNNVLEDAIALDEYDEPVWYSSVDSIVHKDKATDNERIAIALAALGVDITAFGPYNMLLPLSDQGYATWQGNNAITFALIALDTNAYDVPDHPGSWIRASRRMNGVQSTRESLITALINNEANRGTASAGGWVLGSTGTNPDVDTTAMALQALAPYYNNPAYPEVNPVVDRALTWLSNRQQANGHFTFNTEGSTSESSVQVLTALCALGIDPLTDTRFIKNGYTVLDALLTFYVPGGGFKHVLSGRVDSMATDQAVYGLVAYDRFLHGQNRLYDMTDVGSGGGTVITNAVAPVFTADLSTINTGYQIGETALSLEVAAMSLDGGDISYQWYRNTTDNSQAGLIIDAATLTSYTPPTTAAGTYYYYVVATNTNSNVNGLRTATATSSVSRVIVVSTTGGSSSVDASAVAAAKAATETVFSGVSISQAQASNEALAVDYISSVIDGIVSINGVTANVELISYKAPQAGTASKTSGANGELVFKVTFSRGSVASQTTSNMTLVIAATPYAQQASGGSSTTTTTKSSGTTTAVRKTLLLAAISQVERLNESDYTRETWLKLQNALQTARDVADYDGSTQAEVDTARAALLNSMAALVVVPLPGAGGSNSQSGSGNGQAGNQDTSPSNNANTASQWQWQWWWVALIALALSMAGIITVIIIRGSSGRASDEEDQELEDYVEEEALLGSAK
jgi:hypothetical protein